MGIVVAMGLLNNKIVYYTFVCFIKLPKLHVSILKDINYTINQNYEPIVSWCDSSSFSCCYLWKTKIPE